MAFCFSLLFPSLAAALLDGLAIESQTIADFVQTCATVACGSKSGIPDDTEGLSKRVSVRPSVEIRLRVEFIGWLGARRPGCGDAIDLYPKPIKIMKIGDNFIQSILVATSCLVGVGIDHYAALLKFLVEFFEGRRLDEYFQVMLRTGNISVSVVQCVNDGLERYFPPSS